MGNNSFKEMIRHRDILVSSFQNKLKLEVAGVSRTLDFENGAPATVSLQKEGVEYACDKETPDISFIGMRKAGSNETPWTVRRILCERVSDSILETEHVRVTILMKETISNTFYRREYYLYPGLPVIAVANSIKTPVTPNIFWNHRKSIKNSTIAGELESCVDSVKLKEKYCNYQVAKFNGRTDRTDVLVVEQINLKEEKFNGNIFFASDEAGAGIAYLQEAPPSDERRDYEDYDFRVSGHTIYSCGWGIAPEDVHPGEYLSGYRNVLFPYRSHLECLSLLKVYQKRRYPAPWEKKPQIVINPWGCCKFPELCSNDFLLKEINAARRTGATHYQIDDSWQEGKSLLEIAHKNRYVTPKFWQISSELESSFDVLKNTSKKSDIELGLWFAPSFNNEYRDWRQSLKIIMSIYRQYGIRLFKIDGIRIRSHLAEKNLRRLLEAARNESNGEISFNLDVTSGQRPGYFYFLEFGNIFLENRYLSKGLGYHPEKTLRNLWKLGQYVRLQTLQIEIPSPEDIDDEFYQNHSDPREYPLEYWAAISMFANPLLWFAPSTTSEKTLSTIRPILELHRKYHNKIFNGEIFPIGSEPSGKSFTGFLSHNFKQKDGVLIIYREKDAQGENFLLYINYFAPSITLKIIYGHGSIESDSGKLKGIIPDKSSFIMCKYRDIRYD